MSEGLNNGFPIVCLFIYFSLCNVQLPEASSQALFADSQAHIWALQGQIIVFSVNFQKCHLACICV